MSRTPLVSICIPCSNASTWLAATLESVLRQTWTNSEIIVVDDGSTDESVALARSYASRGVQVLTQPRQGAAAARNRASRASRGEYIKFLDADDLISPNMLELQVAALEAKPMGIAYSEWARFRTCAGEAQFLPRVGWRDAAPIDWLVQVYADGQPMMQCGQYLIPRDLLDRAGGWDERLTLIDDFEFFSRLTLASTGVVFTPGAKLYYRSAISTSLSGSRTPAAWQSAVLSVTLGTGYLLAAEDSARTRRSAAAMLQRTIYDMYPAMPELVHSLQHQVSLLGGSTLTPPGGPLFQAARRLIGWKAARRLQLWSGTRCCSARRGSRAARPSSGGSPAQHSDLGTHQSCP